MKISQVRLAHNIFSRSLGDALNKHNFFLPKCRQQKKTLSRNKQDKNKKKKKEKIEMRGKFIILIVKIGFQ